MFFRNIGSEHPYFVGMQAHPEFCTRPLNPSPGYLGFVAASAGILDEQIANQKNFKQPQPDRHLRMPSPTSSPVLEKIKDMRAKGLIAEPNGAEDEFNLNIPEKH